jgi:ribosomal protein S18 acetylase RimI-like enzyme
VASLPDATSYSVRTARADDAPDVARLAEIMYRGLGARRSEVQWDQWRVTAADAMCARLGADLTVVVVEDPGGSPRLLSCGAGTIAARLPDPWHDTALVGYIQWMSTDPAFRRRGLARAVLIELLAWFEGRRVDNVELHASTEGVALYRAAGFWAGGAGLALRRRSWDPPPDPADHG